MLSALKLTVAAVLVSTSLTCLLLQRQFPSATAPRGTTIAAAARPAAATRLALRIPKPGAVASQLPGQRDSILHVTFASSSVTELLHNWALHVQRLRFAAVVAAIDLETAAFCEELGVHHLLAGGGALTGALTAERARLGGRANVRGNATLFLALGASKVDAVAYLLRLGQRPVVVSDVDVAWLSDPTPMVRGTLPGLADFAHADLLASSDCVSAEWDVEDDGCFHTLIDRNTGVLVVRPNDKSAAFLGEWAERTAGAFQAWETDQTAFDDLLRGRRRGHRRASTEAEREAWLRRKKDYCGLPPTTSEESTMGQRSLRPNGVPHATGSRYLYDVCIPGVSRAFTFGIMPVSLVANGHTFFVQQLQTQTGVQPMAVHATYQFGDLADCAFGKRERFREWGLWRVPDDSLLASLAAPEVAPEPDRARAARAPARKAAARAADGAGRHDGVARPAAPPAGEARLLVLHDDDAPLPPPAAWDSERDPHARGRQHVEHVNALLRRLAAGVALGRALNRTVVLPRMYCYCDRYWARLTECTIGRQALPTQPLPFRCPMDHLLPIGGWHGAEANRLARPRCAGPTRPDGPPEEGFPYRTAAWLERLRESAPFFVSSATVRPDGGGRSDSATSRGPRHGALLAHGHTISLPAGASDVRLREAFREAAGRWSQRQPPPAVPLAASREPTLLHVSLEDAASLLGCTSEQPVLATLFQRLFSNRWCYRPEEMTEVRKTANGTVDVCVWGFELPAPPKQCASNAGGAPL